MLLRFMDLDTLGQRVGQALRQHAHKLVVAESCTGGWIAQVVTSVAGSSLWFDRGYVTYSDQSKMELLGVSAELLSRYGAVSQECVGAMADGALRHSPANLALAVTGIAGPAGGTTEKPVGTVWFAWAGASRNTVRAHRLFLGDRQAIRREAVATALQGLIHFIES